MNPISIDAINTIRTLSMDAVQKANSGHPGAPMGLAAAAYTLWKRHLRHDPNTPNWINRDRFILSNGHASMLLYSLLHLTGYEEMTLNQIKNFRQWGSITPGHPETHITTGVETTTGPLGQGLATAVGFALAEAHLHDRFDGLIDHYTYGICSDGDLMEGITSEASSLAGHLKLGKLIFLYDDNQITIDGRTDITFTENVLDRYLAYGWHVQEVPDGNDIEAIDQAIIEAKKVTDKPSLIAIKTTIGFGSPNKADTSAAHGSPLGFEEIQATKEHYNWDHPAFYIPEDVAQHMDARSDGKDWVSAWNEKFSQYQSQSPDKYKELARRMAQELPLDFTDELETFHASEKGLATRKSAGQILTQLMNKLPELIGGSADLAGSNNTFNESLGTLEPDNKDGQNIHYGIREHAMAAIANGMTLHGGCRVFGATFLVFSDYMKPALRIAALSRIPSLMVFTHDSIGLGEDGPTHQPIEQLAMLRSMPNYFVFRPADANEARHAWIQAIKRLEGPSALVLTRQSVPTLDLESLHTIGSPDQGAYVISEPSETPQAILLATGSEVHVCIEAAKELMTRGTPVRVVSMPCWELFELQSETYQNEILPLHIEHRVAVEAASSFGWHRYVGPYPVICMDRFGESAPAEVLFDKFGFNVDHIVDTLESILS